MSVVYLVSYFGFAQIWAWLIELLNWSNSQDLLSAERRIVNSNDFADVYIKVALLLLFVFLSGVTIYSVAWLIRRFDSGTHFSHLATFRWILVGFGFSLNAFTDLLGGYWSTFGTLFFLIVPYWLVFRKLSLPVAKL
jgi:hypothetical protein